MGTVDTLRPIDAAPPNLRDEICGKKRKRPARESEDLEDEAEASLPPGMDPNSPQAIMLSSLRGSTTKPSSLLGDYNPPSPTIEVFLGPSKGSVPVEEPLVATKRSKKKNVAATPAAPAPAAPALAATQPRSAAAPQRTASPGPASRAFPTPVGAPPPPAKKKPTKRPDPTAEATAKPAARPVQPAR
jgi:D-alanyl-D-alanine carboxypeptidase